jgi:hypothetical protein
MAENLFAIITSGMGAIGALLLAYFPLKQFEEEGNARKLFVGLLAVGLIFLAFALPACLLIYKTFGPIDLIVVLFIFVCAPLWIFGIQGYLLKSGLGRKGILIISYILVAFFIIAMSIFLILARLGKLT